MMNHVVFQGWLRWKSQVFVTSNNHTVISFILSQGKRSSVVCRLFAWSDDEKPFRKVMISTVESAPIGSIVTVDGKLTNVSLAKDSDKTMPTITVHNLVVIEDKQRDQDQDNGKEKTEIPF